MLSILFSFVLASLVASASAQATTTWGICFQSQSLPTSPYGPWSVALYGTITVGQPQFFNSSGTPASAGGMRYGQMVTAASMTRVQLNRDGTTSTATLGLATVGVQGSDMMFFNSTPYTDWNGIAFAVQTSTNTPYTGSNSANWIVYPNDFPVQAVELYYDLPTYNYPTEYHCDNQTTATMTIQANSAPTCTPAALSTLQQSALTYQFCYQAYAAANGNQPAWQVAIQGTFLTKTSFTTSNISGNCGLYILAVSGTRSQSVSGGATTSVGIVGQTWHNSGGGDANEWNDDPLLMVSSPYLVSNRGFVLYTASQFTYPNGSSETIDNTYAQATVDPLVVRNGKVVESQGPTPDWSNLAVSCGCSQMTCPLISSSSSAQSTGNLNTQCNAVSPSFSTASQQCSTSGSAPNTAGSCTPTFSSGASHIAVSALSLIVVLASVVAMLL